MSVLIRKLVAPQSPAETNQAQSAQQEFDTGVVVVMGIARWKNSLRVPPQMYLDLWEHCGRQFDAIASAATRASELTKFLSDARALLGIESNVRPLSELNNYCSATEPVIFEMYRKSVDKFEDATVSEGVVRWAVNGRVPPLDMVQLWAYCNKPFDYRKTVDAYGQDLSEFLAQVRRDANNRPVSDEEAFEMRAAFGEGVQVVNVFTGRRHRT